MAIEPYIAEITIYAFNFAPRGWALCDGRLLPIAQNNALFALIGTYYGGNGQTTFGLPDLRGKVALGQGNATSGTTYQIGELAGTETVTLNISQIPNHTHPLIASSDAGDTGSPANAAPANTGNLDKEYKQTLTNPVLMNPAAIQAAGGQQPHSNMQPYLTLNYSIALQGIFPSRD